MPLTKAATNNEEHIDEDRMAAWVALLEARLAVADILEQELEGALGLPLSWHEVLVRLSASAGGRLRMQELARSVLLSKSGITRLVDRMQEAGLVARDSCASDRRVVYAVITQRGRETMDRALPAFARGFEQSFARHLSAADTRALRGALNKILSGNGRTAPPCPSSYLESSAASA